MFDSIIQNPLALAASVLILGLLVGSFLNVVAYRIPIMMRREIEEDYAALQSEQSGTEFEPDSKPAFNLAVPASACPHCQHKIKAWQNIPVVSWLLLKGKCADSIRLLVVAMV